MDSTLSMSSSIVSSPHKLNLINNIPAGFRFTSIRNFTRLFSVASNGSVFPSAINGDDSGLVIERHRHRNRSGLESLFCYDKPIPEEIIEKPVGISLAQKVIGNNMRCGDCGAKGAILCATCSGSGLYVDSILESQGIIVKVRCLGCGGTGNIMCSKCGGRGHVGHK